MGQMRDEQAGTGTPEQAMSAALQDWQKPVITRLAAQTADFSTSQQGTDGSPYPYTGTIYS